MAGHDFGHDFLLHKTPRQIACRALIIREKVFNGVVIQRGHAVRLHEYASLTGRHAKTTPLAPRDVEHSMCSTSSAVFRSLRERSDRSLTTLRRRLFLS